LHPRLTALFALALPVHALAQDALDLEYRNIEFPIEGEEKLTVSGGFESAWYEYSDLDFRALDESSDQAILDSDDRGEFAFTGLSLNLAHRIEDHLSVVVGTSYRGLWGNDQFGNTNPYGGLFYFNAAYLEGNLGQEGGGPRVRVGRQYFEIGGLGAGNDYILADVLDMVRVDMKLGGFGNLILVPVNVFSASTDHDGANFVSYIGQSSPSTFNFRGDTVTRRHGMILESTGLDSLEARAYGFYSDIGAAAVDPASDGYGSGADISYGGLLGNFSDNDWVANFGVRATGSFGVFSPWVHLDGSSGIDRKELVAQDIDCNGLAMGAGLEATASESLRITASYFDAFGPGYSSNGLMFSHGYTGLKGRQAGGLLFNRFLGMHPTAYVSRMGVTDNPQDQSRKSGTREIHAAVDANLTSALALNIGWWMLQDTGLSEVNFKKVDTLQPPFGYARAAFKAQERLGQTLGQEINAELAYQAGEHTRLFMTGGAIVNTEFYATEIERVAGSALGARNPATPWAAAAGTRVAF